MAERRRIGLERALVTPEGVVLRLRLASAAARGGAFILDAAIMLAIVLGGTLLLVAFHTRMGTAFSGLIQILWLLGFFVLRNGYFILAESSARAATIGKRVFRMRVVARDGGRLTGGAIVARNLLREIEIFLPLAFAAMSAAESAGTRLPAGLALLWAAIFLFFPLTNRDRLRVGDLVAGTWVIETERRRIGRELMADDAPPIAFERAELEAYGEFELQRLEEVLRRGDADSIAIVARAIRTRLGRAEQESDDAFLDAYYRALRRELERRMLVGRRRLNKSEPVG